MKHLIAASVLATVSYLSATAPCTAEQAPPPITVKIVDNSGLQPKPPNPGVWVLLTGEDVTASGITKNVPTLVSDLTNNQFTLSAITAGRIFFSYNEQVTGAEPPTSPKRYDKVELTYPGAANLTAVDFFGIPFKLETLDNADNVLQTLTYYTSANSLMGLLQALAPKARVPAAPSAGFARFLSPTGSPGAYPNMRSYVHSVAGDTVTITGTYVGPVGPNPSHYDYSGTFGADGTITLSGEMTPGATPDSQPLTVDGSTLASGIYTNDGPYTVANAAKNPQAVSNNDVYSAIYRDLITGFDFGYIGGRYGSNSAHWYGTTPYNPPFACARTTSDGYFNHYASLIAANSDAYGFPFSDVLALVQVGLNAGGTDHVASLRITILPDDMVDAPIIQSTSSTDDSITVDWNAIPDATDYTVQVSPPLPGRTVPAGILTSSAITGLEPGTPYTISVTASNGNSTSEAMPVIVSTMGSVIPVTGPVTWNFVPSFTGTYPSGHTITFNGLSLPLPTTANPAIQFNAIPGQPGQQNAYVFEWTDENGKLVSSSILYVKLQDSPTAGVGSIDQAPTASFLTANQHTPTYQAGVASNLFLSIAPQVQRTACATELLGGPDPSPTIFGSNEDLKVIPLRAGKYVRLMGSASDADGLRSIAVTVVTSDGQTTTYPATLKRSGHWKATVRTLGSTGILPVNVTAMDRKGNAAKISYLAYVDCPHRPPTCKDPRFRRW